MSLIPVDAEYHYVQDTAPSGANAGDVWLDTSSDPPVAKIYADVGNGLEWLQDQVASRVDVPVSSAGASATDITNAVWSDDQQHLPGQGIDWSTKTWTQADATSTSHYSNTYVDISGSGWLISLISSGSNVLYAVEVDNGTTEKIRAENTNIVWFRRFNQSLKVTGEFAPQPNKDVFVLLD